jgi:hypothetical protein
MLNNRGWYDHRLNHSTSYSNKYNSSQYNSNPSKKLNQLNLGNNNKV